MTGNDEECGAGERLRLARTCFVCYRRFTKLPAMMAIFKPPTGSSHAEPYYRIT